MGRAPTMNIYLVRWPNLSCSLVRAPDRARLLDILDEIGNTEGAQIWEYDGPLFVDFTLPTSNPDLLSEEAADTDPSVPLTADDVDVGDVSRIAALEQPLGVIAEGDTGQAMWEAMLETAFPHLYPVLWDSDDVDFDAEVPVPVERVEAAIRKEAELVLKASWRWANVLKNDDPVARVAAQTGASVEHIRNLGKRAKGKAASPADLPWLLQDVPEANQSEMVVTCSFCGTSTASGAMVVAGPFCGICEPCTRDACAVLGVPLGEHG